jgi:predicted membrane protein
LSAYWIRGLAYIVLAFVIAQVVLLEAQHFPPYERFSEFGYTELSQSGVLAVTALLLVVAALRSPEPAPLLWCLALGFAVLLVRENDQVLELFLPHGIWKYPAAVLALIAAVVFFRHRRAVLDELVELAGTMAFGVLLAGFTTLVFSRLFGRGKFWEAVMEERYWRPVKNAAEEGLELFALALLAAGIVELLLARRNRLHG